MIGKEQIKSWVEQHISNSEQFLVDVKLSPGRLAVFVDKPSGITLEECTSLSRYLINKLEPEGFMESHEIEVSSPGMDTPLLVPQQYKRRIGRELRVFDKMGKEVKGVLQTADDNGFELLEKEVKKEKKVKIETEHVHKFAYADVRETKLIVNFKTK